MQHSIFTYATLILSLALVFLYVSTKVTISDLKEENKTLQTDITTLTTEKAIEQGNNVTLKAQLADLTLANDKLHDKYSGVLVTLTKLRAEPPEIRYEPLYQHIDEEVKSDECEDIKRAIDGTASYINTRMQ